MIAFISAGVFLLVIGGGRRTKLDDSVFSSVLCIFLLCGNRSDARSSNFVGST